MMAASCSAIAESVCSFLSFLLGFHFVKEKPEFLLLKTDALKGEEEGMKSVQTWALELNFNKKLPVFLSPAYGL